MIVKRKLYSVMDEEGNLDYLYDESNGEEKLFSVVEDERLFARGTGAAVYYAEQMMRNKGNKIANKVANREYFINKGRDAFERSRRSKYFGGSLDMNNKKLSNLDLGKINPDIHSLNDIYLKKGKDISIGSIGMKNRSSRTPNVIRSIDRKGLHDRGGDTEFNKYIMKYWKN